MSKCGGRGFGDVETKHSTPLLAISLEDAERDLVPDPTDFYRLLLFRCGCSRTGGSGSGSGVRESPGQANPSVEVQEGGESRRVVVVEDGCDAEGGGQGVVIKVVFGSV